MKHLRGLAGLLLAAAAPALWGQAIVELKIGSRQLFVGEAVELSIEVSNFQTCERPEIPDLPNASVRLNAEPLSQSYTSIVNGHVTQRVTRAYQGELIPRAPGELVVPPIAVRVDGQVLQTRPLTLTVQSSDAGQLFSVEITASRSRAYVGQRMTLTMTIWIRPPKYGNQLVDPGQMLRQINPIDFGPFPRQLTNDPRRPRPRPGGKPDELFYAYEFTTEFTPDRPGRLTFDDIEVGLAYPTQGGTRNLRAHATVQPLDVLPIPMDGRPATFNGAVGLYDIKTSAEPTSVRVGDPIELSIEVFGDGPVETLPPPLLSENAKLVEGFRLPTEQLTGETKDARRRFKLTIRAKRDDVKEIPPIEYPYFDPTAERFVIAQSHPIPLSVAPAAEIAPPDLSSLRTPTAAPAELQALDGLRDVETSESAVLATIAPITPGLVAGVALTPAALFVVAWGAWTFVQSRAGDPARRRRQTALRSARQRIARAHALSAHVRSTSAGLPTHTLASEVSAALAGYLADRLNEPPAHFVGPAAAEFLRVRNVPPGLIEQWATLVQRCDEAAFAGSTQADGETLFAEALECLTKLERQKL